MYAFMVFLGLALGLSVVSAVLDEVLPVKAPKALATTVSVAIAAGLCWALDYSVFRAFGQSLREAWMHPVFSGLVLVGAGEFFRALASSIGVTLSIGGRSKTA